MALHQRVVDGRSAGMRLDLFVTHRLMDEIRIRGLSRSGIQRLIAEGQVTVNGHQGKPSLRVKTNDVVTLKNPPPKETSLVPEPIPLDILFEDDDCIVINKAPGMVVHPSARRVNGTLVNALLHHCSTLEGIGGELRPGIVHRLDKDTSGVMIVGKNGFAFQQLARQFKERTVNKEYLALVWGKLPASSGVIDRPIGRHRSDRKKMSSVRPIGKTRRAITAWEVERCLPTEGDQKGSTRISLLRLKPRTGRTHQIRVHLADLGYPLIGDKIYGRRRKRGAVNNIDNSSLDLFPRQALHAERLEIHHPRTGQRIEFRAPLWWDIQKLLKGLEARILEVKAF